MEERGGIRYMNSICFCFQVHQPYRLKPYGFFQIGQDPFYLDQERNEYLIRRVADRCYIPAGRLLLRLIRIFGSDFKFSISLTGTVVEQMRLWSPEALEVFQALAATGNVEFLSETYYHSLASLFSETEFESQVQKHREMIKREFGLETSAFRNTELIFSNHIADLVSEMGFRTVLLEGVDRVLGWRSPNFLYRHTFNPDLNCLLKNYRLSDDIAFRFSDRGWKEYPLNAEKYSHWIHHHAGAGEIINLFMDFETFGEHHWKDTGILEFMEELPGRMLGHRDFSFRTVSEAVAEHEQIGEIECEQPISWADSERDVSAWLGNSQQRQALRSLYDLEKLVRQRGNENDQRVFGFLQTSDHFYYMSTKHFNDGAVHHYFSPYGNPYDAYVYYMNILHDFRQRLREDGESDEGLTADRVA